MADCDLKGAGILVTRPAHQAEALSNLIKARGGQPLPFPAMEILPPVNPAAARASLQHAVDILVFISPNAVTWGLQLFSGQQLPSGVKLAAIGKGTAMALQAAGYSVDLMPAQRYDSEGLLALHEMQQLTGQQVLIVRGEGGRPVLGDTLKHRGAEVMYAEVYRRHCPLSDPAWLLRNWDQAVDLVTTTSSEILLNLVSILGHAGWSKLQQTPLLVISHRMQTRAQQMGFKRILLADGASDEAIVERLCAWSELAQSR